jgi:hypothetical protein
MTRGSAIVALVLTALGWPTVTSAQTSTPWRVDAAVDRAHLAKQTQNPASSLISVPLQGNWDFGLGDRDATGTLLNIQPVMPYPAPRARMSSCASSCRWPRSPGTMACG